MGIFSATRERFSYLPTFIIFTEGDNSRAVKGRFFFNGYDSIFNQSGKLSLNLFPVNVGTLIGKVNYFWGGKSSAIGWDSRWGVLYQVTAPGSSTTGTYRPYGLDCSGWVDWVFNNSLDYVIGHGGGAASQHTYCTDISWEEAQPGDLAFYPDDSHVGIVVGWDDTGEILVAHCSSGHNNVVVTDCADSDFTSVACPQIFVQ